MTAAAAARIEEVLITMGRIMKLARNEAE